MQKKDVLYKMNEGDLIQKAQNVLKNAWEQAKNGGKSSLRISFKK